jgi:hypothetical protein
MLLLAYTSSDSLAIEADSSKSKSTYLKTQFAGNIGVVSSGFGKIFNKLCLSIDLNYGFISKKINGAKIHSFALRPSWHFCKNYFSNVRTSLYIGISVIYGITQKTYLKNPDYFPSRYYEQNAMHFQPYIGNALSIPLNKKKIEALTLFAEVGSTDNQIWYGYKNKVIKPKDILNLSFGLGFILNNQKL